MLVCVTVHFCLQKRCHTSNMFWEGVALPCILAQVPQPKTHLSQGGNFPVYTDEHFFHKISSTSFTVQLCYKGFPNKNIGFKNR